MQVNVLKLQVLFITRDISLLAVDLIFTLIVPWPGHHFSFNADHFYYRSFSLWVYQLTKKQANIEVHSQYLKSCILKIRIV